MVHKMHIDNQLFIKKIIDGEKTTDIRLYDYKRRMVLPGDYIIFKCRETDNEESTEDMVAVRVKSIHVYSCPIDLFIDISTEECGIGKINSPYEAFVKLIKTYYPVDENCSLAAIKFVYEDNLDLILYRFEEEKKHKNDYFNLDLRIQGSPREKWDTRRREHDFRE